MTNPYETLIRTSKVVDHPSKKLCFLLVNPKSGTCFMSAASFSRLTDTPLHLTIPFTSIEDILTERNMIDAIIEIGKDELKTSVMLYGIRQWLYKVFNYEHLDKSFVEHLDKSFVGSLEHLFKVLNTSI